MGQERSRRLTAGRLLARNTAWSLLGHLVPICVAVAAIPLLIKGLGTERFGLLSVIWVLVGYFSMFDLGLRRALTKLVAERLGSDDDSDVPDLVVTALALVAALGVAAAIMVAGLSPWLILHALKTPHPLASEGVHALWALSISLPFLIMSGALIGLLEAYQQFKAFSVVRMLTGSLTFAGPLLALLWSPSVALAASTIAASRMLATIAYAGYCLHAFPSIWEHGRFRHTLMRPLFRFGGWFTVSNIVGPMMVTLDRFVIGSVLGLTAISYYTIPYEAVTRLWILPLALINVLFPAFTTALAAGDSRLVHLYSTAWKSIILVMGPAILLTVLFAHEGMRLWVGALFAQHATVILRWLAFGVLINSLARLPHALIQGAGRPDLIAKLYLCELPLYLAALWWLLFHFGVLGAAIAWTLRIVFDSLALFALSGMLVPMSKRPSAQCVSTCAGAIILIAGISQISDILLRAGLAVMVLLITGIASAWLIRGSARHRLFETVLTRGGS